MILVSFLIAAKKAEAPALVIRFLEMSKCVKVESWFNIKSIITKAPWFVIRFLLRLRFTIMLRPFKNSQSSWTCLSVSCWFSIWMTTGKLILQHLIAAVRYLLTWAPSSNLTSSDVCFFSPIFNWLETLVSADFGRLSPYFDLKNWGLRFS